MKSMSTFETPIRTKLLFEAQPAARFLSLGFGNIGNSEADVICVASFIDDINELVELNAIIFDSFSKNINESNEDKDRIHAGHCYLFDWSDDLNRHKSLLIICKGNRKQSSSDIETNIKLGLSRTIPLIKTMKIGLQIDVTAMGVGAKYGDIHVRESFDFLVSWVIYLFSACDNIDNVRFVSHNPDTFVDFFEGLYRIKNHSSSLIFDASNNKQVAHKYEEILNKMKGQYEEADKRLSQFIHELTSNPQLTIKGEVIMGNKHVGRDSIEITGNAQVTGSTIGGGDIFQGDYAQKLIQSTDSQSSQADIIKVLLFVQNEIPKLPLSENVMEEVINEVKGAEIQVKKDNPKKEKIVEKLKAATDILKESGKTIIEVVTIGNLLGKVIKWYGEQWIDWVV